MKEKEIDKLAESILDDSMSIFREELRPTGLQKSWMIHAMKEFAVQMHRYSGSPSAEEILAEIGKCSVEDIHDSEPITFHQGECLDAMKRFVMQQPLRVSNMTKEEARQCYRDQMENAYGSIDDFERSSEAWMIDTLILPLLKFEPRVKKVCKEKINGNCPHHNLHCAYPKCEE